MKYTYKLTMMEAVSCSLRYVVLALLRRSGLFRGICLVWLGLLIVNRISISQESVLMYTGIMAGGGLRPVLVYLGFLIVIAFLNSFRKHFAAFIGCAVGMNGQFGLRMAYFGSNMVTIVRGIAAGRFRP